MYTLTLTSTFNTHSFLSLLPFNTHIQTLIHTAFLPCEVVELKRQNVDINPEYSDSLDSELFTVHLMFEKPSAETALAAAAEAQRVGTELSNSSAVCFYCVKLMLLLLFVNCLQIIFISFRLLRRVNLDHTSSCLSFSIHVISLLSINMRILPIPFHCLTHTNFYPLYFLLSFRSHHPFPFLLIFHFSLFTLTLHPSIALLPFLLPFFSPSSNLHLPGHCSVLRRE